MRENDRQHKIIETMQDIRRFLNDEKLHIMRIDDKQGETIIVNVDHNICAYCLAGYLHRFEKPTKPKWKDSIPKYTINGGEDVNKKRS